MNEIVKELNLKENSKLDILFISDKMACCKCQPVMDKVYELIMGTGLFNYVYFGYYEERKMFLESADQYVKAEKLSKDQVNYYKINVNSDNKKHIPQTIYDKYAISKKNPKEIFFSYSYEK